MADKTKPTTADADIWTETAAQKALRQALRSNNKPTFPEDGVGRTLKTLSIFLFLIGVTVAFAVGSSGGAVYGRTPDQFGIGVAIAASAAVSALFTYAFGHAIVLLGDTAKSLRAMNRHLAALQQPVEPADTP